MKVKRSTNVFNPFSINITIETEEEAKALFAIFNHESNQSLFYDASCCEDLKDEIGFAFYVDEDDDSIIANGVTAEDFYK